MTGEPWRALEEIRKVTNSHINEFLPKKLSPEII